jgi:hypothetical protein
MKSKEGILIEVFDPSMQDCTTLRQDLQIAVTLNPDLEKIEEAMDLYAQQCIERYQAGV